MEQRQVLQKKFYVDNILKKELDKIKTVVTKKDRDFVMVIDGEEGSGKSVLAMQIAKYLDPDFNIDKLVFNSDDFIEAIKKVKMNSCVLLDEAYSASNARASLTEVNRAMVGVATEMRQRNLFVIFVLPTFFDLDRYFALWRCRALIHVYFDRKGDRGSYIIFPKTQKKLLYLNGKKKYDYSNPQSPYPPCRFYNNYTVDETAYREKKSQAFSKRAVSIRSQNWMLQRNSLIAHLYKKYNYTQQKIADLFNEYGVPGVERKMISVVLSSK
jgi:ABC-type dipeptide/oligopeptide/nickel transport system ATPase component